MTPFGYKTYQNESLDALRDYLHLCGDMGAKRAFVMQTGQPYTDVDALPGLPYVCLRVPTGGGKTVMACRAVAIVARELLAQERAVVLWLVPTDTIRTQTLNALRDVTHSYRQVLERELKGRVTALDMREALSVQRSTLDADTVVIVSTFAALRVEDTDGRKVYEQNGSLMSHFFNLPAALAAQAETYANGTPVYSLCSALRLRRPLVIVDEAQNARSGLSFDTLARFDPCCIVELTATPLQDATRKGRFHNVLHHVSAAELKAEGMIKLPIRLSQVADPLAVIEAVKTRREDLERIAGQEALATGEYIRPIALLQADKKGQEYTPDRIVDALKQLKIPREHIAVETGAQSELGDIDLSKPGNIRYIITVDKLREGWDCPFAYVLGSVRDMRSRGAVEQILGRVLRMPRATRKQHEELNHAYAIVSSADFVATVNTLVDALVENGFTAYEARAMLPQSPLPMGGLWGETQPASAVAVPVGQHKAPFSVPQLALWTDDGPELLDETYYLEAEWNLADHKAELSEAEFSLYPDAQDVDVDINAKGRVSTSFAHAAQTQLALLMPDDLHTNTQLTVWLDKHIEHEDITQTQAQLFLLHIVDYLVTQRGLPVRELSRSRLRLARACADKINAYRQEHRRDVQARLFTQPPAELHARPEFAFTFAPDNYPVNTRYQGAKHFDRHYYADIADMNGEEADCAWLLDHLPGVRHWVRNLERRPDSAFWLQTRTDRFYPDFVAQLEDGRVLAVEYKGAHLMNPDTDEKRQIGELWQERSDGQCLFLLVGKDDYGPRLRAVA